MKSIEQIVEDAQQAFWASVAKDLPHIKTGDLDFAVALDFSANCRRTVDVWIETNERPGRRLQEQPEASFIEHTRFDCWSPSEDDTTEAYEMGGPRACWIAKQVLSAWASTLSLPAIHPSVLAGPGTWANHYYIMGHDRVFDEVVELILKAGYSVYRSSEMIGIYRTEALP